MSITEAYNNTTFDYVPSQIRVNRITDYNNKVNSSTISRLKQSTSIYGSGIDDYVSNEIKKAKYQGCFDTGSVGNKNIFNDNMNRRNIANSEINQNFNCTKLQRSFDNNNYK